MTDLAPEELRQIREAILRLAQDGRIPCQTARGIAKSLQVPIKAVGAEADNLSIRISQCELGCF